MSISNSTINRLIVDQRGMCWKCGRDLYGGYHVHHGVYTRSAQFQKYLNMPENLLLICPRCHANHGQLSNIETRKKAWKFKVEHGYDMSKWQESIPMLIKDRLEEE